LNQQYVKEICHQSQNILPTLAKHFPLLIKAELPYKFVVSTFRRIPARTWPPLEHFEGLLQWQQVEHSPETTLTTHQFELF